MKETETFGPSSVTDDKQQLHSLDICGASKLSNLFGFPALNLQPVVLLHTNAPLSILSLSSHKDVVVGNDFDFLVISALKVTLLFRVLF